MSQLTTTLTTTNFISQINGGANITVTEGAPHEVTISVSGTTDGAVQVGNAAGALTSLPLAQTNQVLLGNTGLNPSWGTVPNDALTNNSITITAGNNISVSTSPVSLGGNTTIAVTGTTEHAVQIGNATGSLSSVTVGTNGQVLLGATGADPAFATLTSGDGTITFTVGAHSLDLRAGSTVSDTFSTNSGFANPTSGVLQILGSHGLNTTGSGNSVTVAIDNAITLGDLANLSGGTAALTISTGDLTFSATNNVGNINLPSTHSSGNAGVIEVNSNRFIHSFGTQNTFVGSQAGNFSLTVGNAIRNTVVGHLAFDAVTTGSGNVAVGFGALGSATETSSNVAVGQSSLGTATTGDGQNVAVGFGAMRDTTTGIQNTALGTQALDDNETGSNNIAIGRGSLTNLTEGNFNIVIGDLDGAASAYTSDESSNIIIGNIGVISDDNTIRIGTSGAGDQQQNRCFIAGIRGITTGQADAIAVLVDSAGQLGTVSSSRTFKENITDMGEYSKALLSLRPVLFTYTADRNHKQQVGLIAEEVESVLPDLVAYNGNDEPYSVKYHELPVLLLNELQKALRRIEQLEHEIKVLKQRG